MQGNTSNPGADLVLDGRKLIIAFALLVVLCVAFYVWGFVEGKRQASKLTAENRPTASVTSEPQAARPAQPAPQEPPAKKADDRAVREQLSWYQSVKPEPGAKPPDPIGSLRAKASRGTGPAAAASTAPATPPSAVTYSVQVGAFVTKEKAESCAATLEAKGYTSVIDPPHDPTGFYLVKVGKFDARAEAVATQLRLQRDGFPAFVKSN